MSRLLRLSHPGVITCEPASGGRVGERREEGEGRVGEGRREEGGERREEEEEGGGRREGGGGRRRRGEEKRGGRGEEGGEIGRAHV